MIRELAEIRIREGTDQEFAIAVRKAVPLFERAEGCRGMSLERVVETPGLYRLYVLWDRLEDHTVLFRESKDFVAWRDLVGHFFAEPPRVDHSEVAVIGFDRWY